MRYAVLVTKLTHVKSRWSAVQGAPHCPYSSKRLQHKANKFLYYKGFIAGKHPINNIYKL